MGISSILAGTKPVPTGMLVGQNLLVAGVATLTYHLALKAIAHFKLMEKKALRECTAILASSLVTLAVTCAATAAGLIAAPGLGLITLNLTVVYGAHLLFKALFKKPPADKKHPAEDLKAHEAEKGTPLKKEGASLNWPKDLSALKVSDQEKAHIDAIVSFLIKKGQPGNSTLEVYKKGQTWEIQGQKWTLPRTVWFKYKNNGDLEDAYLSLYKEGFQTLPPFGQRQFQPLPIRSYSLLKGGFFRKKADLSQNVYSQLSGVNGCEQLLAYYSKTIHGHMPMGQRKKAGARGITPFFEATLEQLVDAVRLPAGTKKEIILQLIAGLEAIHNLPKEDFDFVGERVIDYPGFHGCLRPSAILLSPTLESYKAAIELSHVRCPNVLMHSEGYASPDLQKARRGQVHQIQAAHGQPGDIWALGLLFALLLKNQTAPQKMDAEVLPDLNFLKQRQGIRFSLDTLQQAEIAGEIQTLIHAADIPSLKQMWQVVGSMLQVDPAQRPTPKQIREKLEAIAV